MRSAILRRRSPVAVALVAGCALALATPHAAAQAHGLFEVHGTQPLQHFGYSVDGAGDVSGDGVPDLIVGETDAFGLPPLQHTVRILSGADGSLLGHVFGVDAEDGTDVAGLGDIDGDGRSDFVIGQPGDALFQVRSGASGALLFSGEVPVPFFGWSVAGLGDVNGDGFGVVVTGIPMYGGWLGGKLVVHSGADFSRLHTIYAPVANSGLGWSVANAGDVDLDGIDDIAATTMSTEGFAAVNSGATGAQLLLIDDIPADGPSQLDIDGLGDIDGDGRNDVVVGNRWDDSNGAAAGRIVVLSSKPEPWTDLGSALPGGAGAPTLSGAGTLAAGSPGFLRLLGAPPSAPGALLVGLAALNAPVKGGTLVPAPHLVLHFTTSPAGSLLLPWSSWPAGLPGFTQIWFQAWTSDPTAPAGAGASNALLAMTPP
ncbi:MAG TPA: hypothetical protein VFD43_05825 [Planctomycetota bacterium]|nr:hypothetical protein [Planctomycetota bacterium]